MKFALFNSNAYLLFAAVVLVGVGGISHSCFLEARAENARLDNFGRGAELDSRIAVDASSGQVAYSYDSGEGGLFIAHPGRKVPIQVPTTIKWPKEPYLSPAGRHVAYIDHDPDRYGAGRRLYITDLKDGRTRLLVSGTKEDRVGRAVFAPDGKSLVYEIIHMQLKYDKDEFRRVDLSTYEDTRLYVSRKGSARSPIFSRDGRKIYFLNQRCVMSLDLLSHQSREIACLPVGGTMGPTPIGEPPAVSIDETRIVVTVLERGCPRLRRVNLATKAFEPIGSDECGHQPHFLGDTSERIAFVGLPLDGNRIIKVAQWDQPESEVIGPKEGISYQISVSGSEIYSITATPHTTRKLFRYDTLKSPLKDAAKVLIAEGTHTSIEGELVSSVERTYIPSSDGIRIPIRVFHPKCRHQKPGPVVLYIHGSPDGRDDVSPRLLREIGYLLGRGIAVVGVNYRGSTGYGEEFKDAGTRDLQAADVVSAADALVSAPYVSKGDFYAMGICYGAEHILRSLIEARSKLFKGAIIWSGWQLPQQWLKIGHPDSLWVVTEREGLLKREVALLADKNAEIIQPTDRVVVDETHLLIGGENRLRALTAVADFIEQRSPHPLCKPDR